MLHVLVSCQAARLLAPAFFLTTKFHGHRTRLSLPTFMYHLVLVLH